MKDIFTLTPLHLAGILWAVLWASALITNSMAQEEKRLITVVLFTLVALGFLFTFLWAVLSLFFNKRRTIDILALISTGGFILLMIHIFTAYS